MPADVFQKIDSAIQDQSHEQTLAAAIQHFEESKDWHNLFDSLMLQKKYELGIDLRRASSLQDIPEAHRKQIESVYVEAARKAGQGFLSQGDLTSAWIYFKVIREPEAMRSAIAALPDTYKDYSEAEKLIGIALYEGVNPAKGIQVLLNSNGPCNTITTLDQTLPQMSVEDRALSIAVIVRRVYDDITASVRRQIEQKFPQLEQGITLSQLLQDHNWIFEGGGYHTDPSHLNSVVRFARSLRKTDAELDLACQLAEYGQKIDPALQYPGEPPFEDFFAAHLAFFKILRGVEIEESLGYFTSQFERETDPREQSLLAYVLVDLLVRLERFNDAAEIARRHLTGLGEEVMLSFDELCEKSGRWDLLKQVYREQNNPIGYTSALIRESRSVKNGE